MKLNETVKQDAALYINVPRLTTNSHFVSSDSLSEQEAIHSFPYKIKMLPKEADTDAAQALWCWQLLSSNKDTVSFLRRLGKLLQSSLASLFLSFFCLLGVPLSCDGETGGVQRKPSRLKSHHRLSSIRQSVDTLPAGSCHRLGSIILRNDTGFR